MLSEVMLHSWLYLVNFLHSWEISEIHKNATVWKKVLNREPLLLI